MSNETTYSGILGELSRLQAALATRISEIPHLAQSKDKLEALLNRANALARQQAGLIADKQEASQLLRETVADAQRLGTVLRKGVRQHYGIRSERLAEFGIQPFRGNKSKPAPEEPEKPTPAEAPASSAK